MPRPGTDILITEPSPGGGGELDLGQAFMIGEADRGPTVTPATVHSQADWERFFGSTGGLQARNSARAFFTERGANMSFVRLVGDAAKTAEVEMGELQVSASSPGTWANDVTVTVVSDVSPLLLADPEDPGDGNGNGDGNGSTPPAPVRIVVTEGGVVTERSARLRTIADAVSWASQTSQYLSVAADDGTEEDGIPVTATPAALAGGVDDANITPSVVATALSRFTYNMGFAQVLYPGCTDPDMHAAILDHCWTNRRPALLDLNDTDEPSIAADANALHVVTGSRYACALAPRLVYPGPVAGTTALVPYSAIQAGIIARADAQTGNPNEAAAGNNGESLAALALSLDFDDDTRELLNDLGVTLPKLMRSDVIRTYGTRTVAGPDDTNWMWFPGARTILAMAAEFDNASEEFVHRQIDGQGRLFTKLQVALGGICLDFFGLGALYGDQPEDAFTIDTGPSVNTIDTIANGEVHAVVRVRVSPPGEWVQIEIQKTPLSMAV